MRSMNAGSARSMARAALLALLLGMAGPSVVAQDADEDADESQVADEAPDGAVDGTADDSTDDTQPDDEPAAQAADVHADDPADDGNATDAGNDDAQAAVDPVDDDTAGADAAEAGAEGGRLAELQTWDPVPMSPTEAWAPPVSLDESEYTIPVDTQLDPTGEEWVVLEAEMPAGAAISRVPPAQAPTRPGAPPLSPAARAAAADVVPSGRLNADDMPVLRAPKPGAKPLPTNNEDTPYSTGGKPIRAYGAPWQVQIYYPDNAPQWADDLKKGKPLWQLQHFCGGALISDSWVLTAAHCIDDDMVRAGYRVRVGATDISKGDGITYKIERIVRHSQYREAKLPDKPNMFMNDIALIKIVADSRTLGAPDPQNVKPITLNKMPLKHGDVVTATGWGKTEPSNDDRPNAVLMRVVMQVMDTERCKNLPEYGPDRITDKVICAADAGKSTCRGDSGGALTKASGTTAIAVGIVSWGKGRCSGDGQPGAYTRIDQYQDWIKQAMALPVTKTALP